MNTGTQLVLGVLGSGRGSNLHAIQQAIAGGRLSARIGCVIADVADAYILERARTAGIPAFHDDMAPFRSKLEGDAENRVIDLLKRHDVNLLVLAGFMRMVKPGLLKAFPGRVINIHPSLLPSFPGLKAWEQALDYGVKVTGCTVHFVDEGMDTGPIILQKTTPVLDDDTAQTLHARIQEQEHLAYPEALQMIEQGCLRIEGRRIVR